MAGFAAIGLLVVAGEVSGALLGKLTHLDDAGEVLQRLELRRVNIVAERHRYDRGEHFRGAVVEKFHIRAHHLDRRQLASFLQLSKTLGCVARSNSSCSTFIGLRPELGRAPDPLCAMCYLEILVRKCRAGIGSRIQRRFARPCGVWASWNAWSLS